MSDGFDYNVSAVAKCESCGADMVYDPEIGALHCSYCDSTKEIQKRVPSVRDYDKECAHGDVRFDGDKYVCPNCGGNIDLPPLATAVKCPFCAATNIVKVEDLKGLKPDSILPFTISKQRAADAGKKWIRRKLYAPLKLKREFKIENFKGVYIPSFAFSSDTASDYSGRLGERRTRVVGSGKDSHTETYIHWYNVSGSRNRKFVDMTVEASLQLEQSELNKITPYDFVNAEAYNSDYISGFYSERYDTSLKDSFKIAREQMEKIIKDEIVASYHADVVGNLDVKTVYSNRKFRYTLLPLWVCAYKYKKKGYKFLVNGRTGKSTGKSPVSPIKVGLTVLLALGIIALIAWLVISGQFVEIT